MVGKGNRSPGPEICVILSTVPASKSRDIARALLDRASRGLREHDAGQVLTVGRGRSAMTKNTCSS